MHVCAFFLSFSFFLKIEFPASRKTSAILNHKQSTLTNNATPFHSLAAAKPENTIVKNFHGKQAKPETSEKPCKYNVKERRSMERPKK